MAATIPMVDFSVLGSLPETYRRSQLSAARDATLKQAIGPDGSIDYGRVLGGLAQAGDIEGLLQFGRVKQAADERAAEREWRQAESARAQRNWEASHNLALEQSRRPDVREVEDPITGQKRLVLVDRAGRGVTDVTPVTVAGTIDSRNPYAPPGKFTESQSKDLLYANRMHNAERTLRETENVATNAGEKVLSKVPMLSNYLVSSGYQKFDQASRDFINAVLRRESGAVISDAEFANAQSQYLPQPGDSPEKLALKRQNRMTAIQGIASGAGPAYRPPYRFGQQGEIIEYGTNNQPDIKNAGQLPNIGGPGSAKAAPAPSQPVRVNTPEDAMRLPSGTVFITPDGRQKVRP